MIFNNPVKNILRWRYLDSLDSIRFGKNSLELRDPSIYERLEQATIEVSVAFLMGNGIIVPNNQLIDSYGFLRIASDIIKAATNEIQRGKNIFFPIKFANWPYTNKPGWEIRRSDPFQLAGYIFSLDGGFVNGEKKKFYELSAWPELGEKRLEWAESLNGHCPQIKKDLFSGLDDYEPELAEDLISILNFFSRNENKDLMIDAAGTMSIRQKLFGYISNLKSDNFASDEFLSKIVNSGELPKIKKMEIISKVFKILKDEEEADKINLIDDRSEIRKRLFDYPSRYFTRDSNTLESARMGVLETIDSIYNFTGFLSTTASQDNQTELMDKDDDWGFDEAAYALGRWAREKYYKKSIETDNGNNSEDIFTAQDVYIKPSLNRHYPASNDAHEFWKNYFNFQINSKWTQSLDDYSRKLKELEKSTIRYNSCDNNENIKIIEKDLDSKIEKYEIARNKHIEVINSNYLSKHQYEITIENKKAYLNHYDGANEIISKVQIEDFSHLSKTTRINRSAINAKEPVGKQTTIKGSVAEYGGKNEI